jgi:alkyl hydroperoxide reductase subunit AhpF
MSTNTNLFNTVEKHNKLLTRLVEARNRVDILSHRLLSIKNANRVTAQSTIEIDGNKRSAFTLYFSKQQVEAELTNDLDAAQKKLSLLESEYIEYSKKYR